MNQQEIDKIFKSKKSYFFISIGLILISIILYLLVAHMESNEVTPEAVDYGNLIANQKDQKNDYIKTTIVYISQFAEDEDGLKYYYMQDVNNRLMIARISDNTLEKIVETYQLNKDNFSYDLEGYIFTVPKDLKELAISGFDSVFGNQGIELDEQNYEKYFGSTYLNEFVTPGTNFQLFLIGAGILFDFISIVLMVLCVVSIVRVHKIMRRWNVDLIKQELLQDSTKIFKKQKMYLTDNYIVSLAYGVLKIVRYEELIWVYSQMFVGSGLFLNHFVGITKKSKEVLLSASMNQSVLDEIAREIQSKNRNIRIGFTSENIKRYRGLKRTNKNNLIKRGKYENET